MEARLPGPLRAPGAHLGPALGGLSSVLQIKRVRARKGKGQAHGCTNRNWLGGNLTNYTIK